MLNLNTHGSTPVHRRGEGPSSRSASVQGRRSGEIVGITEEDEDEVEEVEEFSPIVAGNVMEEVVIESLEEEAGGDGEKGKDVKT
jgi:hypothetical protein